MIIWEGEIKINEKDKGLVKMILEKYEIKPEEVDDGFYFKEYKDPSVYGCNSFKTLINELIQLKDVKFHVHSYILTQVDNISYRWDDGDDRTNRTF